MDTLFNRIHDCVDFSEADGIKFCEAQKLTTTYTNILITGIFNSAFRIWGENWNHTRIRIIAIFNVPHPTANTGKCMGKQTQPMGTKMPLYPSLKVISLKPMDNLQTWPLPLLWIVVYQQHPVKSTHVWPKIWKNKHILSKKSLCCFKNSTRSVVEMVTVHIAKLSSLLWTTSRTHTSLSCMYPKKGHKRE